MPARPVRFAASPTPPSTTWACVTANLTDGNQIMHQLLVEDLVTAPDLTPRQGKLGLLEAAGLGMELDRDAVERAAELYARDERYHHS